MSRTISYTIDTELVTAFEPKPFIRALEAAVDRLIAVRKDVQARTEQMEKSVKVSEREYSKKMAELNKGFEVRSFVIDYFQFRDMVHRQLGNPSQGWRPR